MHFHSPGRTRSSSRPASPGPERLPGPPVDLADLRPQFLAPGHTPDQRRRRLFDIETAPTFYPTHEQFQNSLSYIESIRPHAERYGICKITFFVQPRIQNLSLTEGQSRSIVMYLDRLQKFHAQSGRPLSKVPTVEGRPLDFFRLQEEIRRWGGHDEVTTQKKWTTVSKALGLNASTSTPSVIKLAYMRWILPYEEYIDGYEKAVMEKRRERMEKGLPDIHDADPYSARHARNTRKKTMSSHAKETVVSPPREASNSEVKPVPGQERCEICRMGDRPSSMLLCDECDRGFHMSCLIPRVKTVPQCEWYCPKCLSQIGDDYGYEEGKLKTLSEFRTLANTFKANWFHKRRRESNIKLQHDHRGPLYITEDEVEREFWRLVESPYDEVVVEYGADLHTVDHGSGFPTVDRNPDDPYSSHSWNLNNIPTLPESLLRKVRTDISGMMIPWMYVGMVFSTFCWHTEDHFTYSINYMHWGETKTWYGIPASNALKFEDSMRKAFPDLFRANPDLLFHLTTLVSPKVLKQDGVAVYACDQRAGEFVVTFPRAYHGGFNHGLNCAEAVNFALPDWLPHGYECVKRYMEFKKPPVFSHEELIVKLAVDASPKLASWLAPHFRTLINAEAQQRTQFCSRNPSIPTVVVKASEVEPDDNNCVNCSRLCYLSCLKCPCDLRRSACLTHPESLCSCDKSNAFLRVRLKTSELEAIYDELVNLSSDSRVWHESYVDLLNLSSKGHKPRIDHIKSLLDPSAPRHIYGVEIKNLEHMVAQGAAWISRALPYFDHLVRADFRHPPAQKLPPVPLSDLEKIYNEGLALAYTFPELEQLTRVMDDVRRQQSEINELLNRPALPDSFTEALNGLYQESLDSGVLIPEASALIHRLDGIQQWHRNVRGFVEAPYQIESIVLHNWINEASSLRLPASFEPLRSLLRMRDQAEAWKRQAIKLSETPPLKISQIEKIIRNGEWLPIHPNPQYQEFEKQLKRAQTWSLNALRIYDKLTKFEMGKPTRSTRPTWRPTMGEVLELLHSAKERTPMVQFDEVPLFLRHTDEARQWISKAWSTLSSTGRESEDMTAKLIEHLQSVNSNIDDCIRNAQSGNRVCICRGHDSEYMIQCRICEEYYHLKCLRIVDRTPTDPRQYVCMVCRMDTQVYRHAAWPNLRTFESLLVDAESLAIEPPGQRKLSNVVISASKWSDRLAELYNAYLSAEPSGRQAHLEILKAALRCTLGMTVTLYHQVLPIVSKLPSAAALGPESGFHNRDRDTYDDMDQRGLREIRDGRDGREVRESQEMRPARDTRDGHDVRDGRETREGYGRYYPASAADTPIEDLLERKRPPPDDYAERHSPVDKRPKPHEVPSNSNSTNTSTSTSTNTNTSTKHSTSTNIHTITCMATVPAPVLATVRVPAISKAHE
ncbi:uncharacterized protein BJ171DRAFT_599788 [Polychytrium aggregatum]|uniref:uncharacterized protein n=1 Tax=Polychytrium aggregatum TaxID=110093 RepID=UPI0022FECFFC|nr:uncharacterized protein BJ171DRAFT_599788 [Polychytrium aggregatum]KAI9203893.1 hypothetical protein BJ171DRAFT_599788 [Polychytrium aggregatum]